MDDPIPMAFESSILFFLHEDGKKTLYVRWLCPFWSLFAPNTCDMAECDRDDCCLMSIAGVCVKRYESTNHYHHYEYKNGNEKKVEWNYCMQTRHRQRWQRQRYLVLTQFQLFLVSICFFSSSFIFCRLNVCSIAACLSCALCAPNELVYDVSVCVCVCLLSIWWCIEINEWKDQKQIMCWTRCAYRHLRNTTTLTLAGAYTRAFRSFASMSSALVFVQSAFVFSCTYTIIVINNRRVRWMASFASKNSKTIALQSVTTEIT